MKLLLPLAIFAVLLVVGANKANALTVKGLKDHRTKVTGIAPDISKADVATLWASSVPACIKDGAKVLTVNAAFQKANLGYRDCSSGEKTLAKHRKLGIRVAVIQAYQLPANMLTK